MFSWIWGTSETEVPKPILEPVIPEKVESEPVVPEKVDSEPVVPEKVKSEHVVPEKVESEPVVPEKVESEPVVLLSEIEHIRLESPKTIVIDVDQLPTLPDHVPTERSVHDLGPMVHDLVNEIDEMLTTMTDASTQTPLISKTSLVTTRKSMSSESDLELMSGCLYAMGLDGHKFCQKMKDNRALMADSFPLQCLLGEYYVGSDINLYFNQIADYYAFIGWISEDMVNDWVVVWEKINMPNVIGCRKYQINGETTITMVLIDTTDLPTYLHDHIDFSFCQTFFDGQTLTYTDLTLRKVGTVVNYDPNREKPLTEIVKRIQKYQDRGYLIMDADQFQKAYDSIYGKKIKKD